MKFNLRFRGMIIFWEKNGLRHLEFILPYIKANQEDNQTQPEETNLTVTYMQWNKDSDILALLARYFFKNILKIVIQLIIKIIFCFTTEAIINGF